MEQQVMELRQQLAEAEHNTVLAATFGKQLLEKNQLLEAKQEALEQDKHCLALKLEASVRMEQSLVQEVEALREQQGHQVEAMEAQAAHTHDQNLQRHSRKIMDLESIIGSQRLEIAQQADARQLLEAQVRETREQLDAFSTPLDQSVDDSTNLLQAQVTALTQEKQELETIVSALKVQLSTSKYRREQAERRVFDLESALEEKECQFTSYYNALEKNKDEMMEMRMEIESLKLAETDPGRKGNSLFAEVEDQRQAMERQLINYKTNNNILKNQFDLKTQEAAKLKLQVASLLSLSSNRASMEYVSHVEESLASARAQLQTFAQRCRQLEEAQQTMAEASCHESPDEMDHAATQLFKNLYTESKKKQAELNQLLHQAQFDKVVLSDRILQLQRKLRQLETTVDASHGEVIRLRVKLDDLACKKGEKAGNDVKKVKLVLQKLPVFDAQQPTPVLPEPTTVLPEPTTVLPEPTTPTTVLPKPTTPTTVLPEPSTPTTVLPKPTTPTTVLPEPSTPTTVLPKPTTPTTVLPEPSTHHETATHPETTAQHNPTTQQEVTTHPAGTTQQEVTTQQDPTTHPEATTHPEGTTHPDATTHPEGMPLKEKLVDPTTTFKQEVTEHTNTICSSEGVALGNEENLPPLHPENLPPLHPETRKKPKKTVQLTEVVTVHLSDGKVQETKIKQEDGLKKVERKHKPLRKLECPVTQVGGGGGEQIEECKTQ